MNLKETTGVIIMGTDERRQPVKNRPLRASLIGELPADYRDVDYIDREIERGSRRNASALYLGVGRWGVWLYWRRRPAPWRWLSFRDIRAEHIRAEEAVS